MTGLKIVAKTPQGRAAMEQHLKEQAKEPWHQRQLFKQLYQQEIIQEPFTIIIHHKNAQVASLIPFASMIIPIHQALTKNYAKQGKDYEVQEV